MKADNTWRPKMRWKCVGVRLAVTIAACLAAATPALAFQLITPAEAALLPAEIAPLQLRGSPTRRPHVIVVSPARGAGAVYSPLELKLKFRAYGGAQIDLNSVVVTYLKQPNIDLTPRLRPFIAASGIDIKSADVPPGMHQFWIELKDEDGRIGGTEFGFQVIN